MFVCSVIIIELDELLLMFFEIIVEQENNEDEDIEVEIIEYFIFFQFGNILRELLVKGKNNDIFKRYIRGFKFSDVY